MKLRMLTASLALAAGMGIAPASQALDLGKKPSAQRIAPPFQITDLVKNDPHIISALSSKP